MALGRLPGVARQQLGTSRAPSCVLVELCGGLDIGEIIAVD